MVQGEGVSVVNVRLSDGLPMVPPDRRGAMPLGVQSSPPPLLPDPELSDPEPSPDPEPDPFPEESDPDPSPEPPDDGDADTRHEGS